MTAKLEWTVFDTPQTSLMKDDADNLVVSGLASATSTISTLFPFKKPEDRPVVYWHSQARAFYCRLADGRLFAGPTAAFLVETANAVKGGLTLPSLFRCNVPTCAGLPWSPSSSQPHPCSTTPEDKRLAEKPRGETPDTDTDTDDNDQGHDTGDEVEVPMPAETKSGTERLPPETEEAKARSADAVALVRAEADATKATGKGAQMPPRDDEGAPTATGTGARRGRPPGASKASAAKATPTENGNGPLIGSKPVSHGFHVDIDVDELLRFIRIPEGFDRSKLDISWIQRLDVTALDERDPAAVPIRETIPVASPISFRLYLGEP